jgi:hypothetical protein
VNEEDEVNLRESYAFKPANWSEVSLAWALWISDRGPPVQYTDNTGAWRTWVHSTSINSAWGKEWRVKPAPKRVRPCYNPRSGSSAMKVWYPGKSEPILGIGYQWVPGSAWLEIPDAGRTPLPPATVNGCKRVRPYYHIEKKVTYLSRWYPGDPEPVLGPAAAWVPGSTWLEIPR